MSPNPSIEPTRSELRPPRAAHVKRWAADRSMLPIRILTPMFLALAIACGGGADAQHQVSADGFGGVRIGMTVADASKAYGSPLEPAAPVLEDERSCFYVFPGGVVGPVSFMVVDEHVARVDIDGPGALTAEGVGVGSSESEVQKAYAGRVLVSSHPYTGPEGHYLTVEPRDAVAIIFETDGDKVTRYRAGRVPPVGWIEGCS